MKIFVSIFDFIKSLLRYFNFNILLKIKNNSWPLKSFALFESRYKFLAIEFLRMPEVYLASGIGEAGSKPEQM